MYDQDQGLTGRYHNTTLDTNKIIQALYYKLGASRAQIHSSNTNESAEATLFEYRHELNKFSLRRLAQKYQRSKRQGLLPGSLLTTPGRRRSPRSSRRPSSSHRWWHLAPGIHHLITTFGYRGKGESKATVSTHPKYSQARIHTTNELVPMKWVVYVD